MPTDVDPPIFTIYVDTQDIAQVEDAEPSGGESDRLPGDSGEARNLNDDNRSDNSEASATAAGQNAHQSQRNADTTIVSDHDDTDVIEQSTEDGDVFQGSANHAHSTSLGKRRRADQCRVEDEDDDEASQCIICFEAWSQLGPHRVVACIRKWLSSKNSSRKSHGKCPQCNQQARLKDIRPIWVRRVVAVDNGAVLEAERVASEERARRVELEVERAKAQMAYRMAMESLEMAQSEIQRLQTIVERYLPDHLAETVGDLAPEAQGAAPVRWPSGNREHASLRALSFGNETGTMLIGCKEPSATAGERYGIARVRLDGTMDRFASLHDKSVRDLHVHTLDSLQLTVSLDRTMQLSSLDTPTASVQTFDLGAPGWSCAWQPKDPAYIAAGLANGTVLLFDRRHHLRPLRRLEGARWLGIKPTHSLAFLGSQPGAAAASSSGGIDAMLAAANFDRVLVWHWDELCRIGVSTDPPRRVLHTSAADTSCYAMSVDPVSGQCLLSHRQGYSASTRHVAGSIGSTNTPDDPASVTFQVQSSVSLPLSQLTLARNALFSVGAAQNGRARVFAGIGVNASHTVQLFDMADGTGKQVLNLPATASALAICHQPDRAGDGSTAGRLAVITGTHLYTYNAVLT
ncbi:hypothetical protein THASP1DRAFT_29579 [Thamnocephalis sphaerospora]|uniref:RING-type E3 ubiquitin transferase n=1 Tax=Thamnocephalis sphaerospora TaxID=78915 RepID=A0A4P9XRA8_9FUNG|nr:hypothetical protein THASP1DRAFT_29579 [Thamnocephalis sphaerospora]|eukprot:RKP08613.1 hypothetical protein THASP1DRAFT_29579 [Thamnocephalis sphaerospora]